MTSWSKEMHPRYLARRATRRMVEPVGKTVEIATGDDERAYQQLQRLLAIPHTADAPKGQLSIAEEGAYDAFASLLGIRRRSA